MSITFLEYITFQVEIEGVNSETASNILLEDFNRISKIDAKIIETLHCGEEVLLVTFSCKHIYFTEGLKEKIVTYIKNRLAKTKQQIVADLLK